MRFLLPIDAPTPQNGMKTKVTTLALALTVAAGASAVGWARAIATDSCHANCVEDAAKPRPKPKPKDDDGGGGDIIVWDIV